jgi:hypothetical protein
MVSRRFVEAVKLAPKKSYRIAQEAGLHPATLSKLVNGIELVRPNDRRVLAVANVLGLSPGECFADSEAEQVHG